MNLTDFENAVATRIQQDAAIAVAGGTIPGTLTTTDREDAIAQAVKQRYSKDRPNTIVTDVTADGTSFLPLPTGYEVGFSVITQLEYPIGSVPPNLIEPEDWEMYQSPTGWKVMLKATTPPAADLVRVNWTQRHVAGNTVAPGQTGAVATSVPDADFEAVSDLAAALCAEKLAARYAQLRDATIGADVNNYGSKAQDCLKLASALRKRYDNHVGADEDNNKTAPALAVGDMELNLSAGIDRITHRRR
jgi:hypothetical protein